MGPWWPTLKVDTILFDGDRTLSQLSDFRLDADAISAFCDLWVPKFVAEAPQLSYIHEMFDIARGHEKLARNTKIPRMLDSMLEGTWSSDAEAEFFPDLIVPDDQEKILSWVGEHPDGIERDVHGEVYEVCTGDGEIEVSADVLFPLAVPTKEQFAMLAAAGFGWFPEENVFRKACLLYTSPSPRDRG